MIQLQLNQIKKSHPKSSQPSFQCEELRIAAGTKLGVAGETGSGKSTLLRIIAGLEKPDEGVALFNGVTIFPRLDRLIAGHPEMAYLSQSFELPKFITVEDYLDYHQYDEQEIERIAEICRIKVFLKKDTRALSGGERQRTALAKVLLKQPQVLLLDEPYSSLDPHHKRTMKEVIDMVSSEAETTIIKVSHDPADLLPWADEVLVLKGGEIIQRADPKHIYQAPKNAYVAGLFGEYTLVESSQWASETQLQQIIRPEHFTLGQEGQEGEVVSVKYKGTYEMLSVRISDHCVLVSAGLGDYCVGDRVKVSLKRRK